VQLRKLHINDYKMFKNFDMSFVDKDDNPLPIIVLAGVNGSGKTTLLEYVYDYMKYLETRRAFLGSNFIEIVARIKKPHTHNGLVPTYETPLTIHTIQRDNFTEYIDIYKQNIIYIPAGIDDIQKVESEFVKYWYNLVKFHNKRNDEITESLQTFIKETFKGLALNVTYSHIDEDDNIFFKNKKDEKFKISELSTGEKTLLSKVLYLFFQDYKNKVILIDEPELSLHPAWQNRVLKLYENFANARENNCQIIIATHSPHIIGSAKNEYLRILTKDGVIDDVLAYGRDIEWVLEEVMGAKSTREESISKKIKECQALLNDDKYDEAEICIDNLEKVIGENDSEILAMRNDISFWRD